jgi:hypothetical protein
MTDKPTRTIVATYAANPYALLNTGQVGIIRSAGSGAWCRYELHALRGVPREDVFPKFEIGSNLVVETMDVVSVSNFWVLLAHYLAENDARFDIERPAAYEKGQPAITDPMWIKDGEKCLRVFYHVCDAAEVTPTQRVILAYVLLHVKLSLPK